MSGHCYDSPHSLRVMNKIEGSIAELGAASGADLCAMVKLSKGAMANYLRIMWLDGRIKRAPRPAGRATTNNTQYWQVGTDADAQEKPDTALAPVRPVLTIWAPNHARDPLCAALFGAPKALAARRETLL